MKEGTISLKLRHFYQNMVLVALLLVGCSPHLRSTEQVNHCAPEGVLAQALDLWSLVNVVRSVSQQDALAFHDMLFNSTLELYTRLHCVVQHQVVPTDITILDQALNGVNRSHRGLYRNYPNAELLGARRLIHSIDTLWTNYKETISYHEAADSTNIGVVVDRLL